MSEANVSLEQAMAEADAFVDEQSAPEEPKSKAETSNSEDNRKVETKESSNETAKSEEAEPKATPEAKAEPSKDSGEATEDADGEDKPETAKFEKVIKVNGRELKITDEAEYDRYAQMGLSANERWREAAEIRKLAKNVFEGLREDTSALETARRIGMPIDSMLEAYFQEKVAEYKMTPEERELAQRRKQFESERREWEEQQEKAKAAERDAAVAKMQQQTELEMESAIKSFNLPETKSVKLRILEVAKQFSNPQADYVMPLSHAAQIVQQEITSLYGDLPKASPPEGAEEEVAKTEEKKPKKRSSSPRKPSKAAPRHRIRVGSVDFMEDIQKLLNT